MSFDLGNNPPSDTLRLLARYLSRLCTHNTPDEQQRADPARHCTSFHARVVPPIDLHSYLVRILKYCPCANEVFISLAVYAKRLEANGIILDRFNVHRLCISGVVVASKYFSDIFFTNSRYAKIKFMELLNYRIHVTIPELQTTGEFLSDYRPRPNSIVIPPIVPPSQPPTPSLPIDIAQTAWRTQTETPVSANHLLSPGEHDRPQSAGGLRRPSDTGGVWTQQMLQQRRPRTSGHQRAVSYHPSLPTQNYRTSWKWQEDVNGALSPEAPTARYRANTANSGYTSPIQYDHSPVNALVGAPMLYYQPRNSQHRRSMHQTRRATQDSPKTKQNHDTTNTNNDDWVKRPIPLNVTKQVNALENSSSSIYHC